MKYIIGALVAWFICSFAFVLEDECLWVDIMDKILRFPCFIFWKVVCVLAYPFIWCYRVFLRHTLHPVSPDVLEVQKIIADSRRVWGNTYFCHDKKAKAFYNKIFFFRIDPTISNPNKPSSPEGNFRLGVDN